MANNSHYDVIIIGQRRRRRHPGAQTRVHRKEDSHFRTRRLRSARERQLESSRRQSRREYQTKEQWQRQRRPGAPSAHELLRRRQHKFYGAALFRLRKEDFGEIHHHGGVSPAWPLSYKDMEPYYTEAERLYHVHGNQGEDPTEPHRSGPYPYPAVSHEPRIQQLSDDFAQLGLRPFHTPLGVMLNEKDSHASRCIRCETCDGFPCLVSAKSDAQVCAVDPALQILQCHTQDRRLCPRLETGASGREISKVIIVTTAAVRKFRRMSSSRPVAPSTPQRFAPLEERQHRTARQ